MLNLQLLVVRLFPRRPAPVGWPWDPRWFRPPGRPLHPGCCILAASWGSGVSCSGFSDWRCVAGSPAANCGCSPVCSVGASPSCRPRSLKRSIEKVKKLVRCGGNQKRVNEMAKMPTITVQIHKHVLQINFC